MEQETNNREIALDMISAVPAQDYIATAFSVLNPKPFTEKTLQNIENCIETGVVQSMSVVAARAFDTQSIIESDIPIQSVDTPLTTGIQEIFTAYKERTSGKNLNPKEIAKTILNIGGEFLMHSDEVNAPIQTGNLLKTMMEKRNFGILRLDSTEHLTNIKQTVDAVRYMKSLMNGYPMLTAVELKPSSTLPDLISNLNAFEDLKQRFDPLGIHTTISLDVRAISSFCTDEEQTIQLISNLLNTSSKNIGMLELSGQNHTIPFEDTISNKTLQMVQEREKRHRENNWAKDDKLAIVLETHPLLLKDLLRELPNHKDLLY